ncbi:hypothetical protein [Paenibacillus flagellatus]|nr:hypothetical protein [Paenibacillus flagellatus]
MTERMLAGIATASQEELELFIDQRDAIVEQIRQSILSGGTVEPYRERIAAVLKADPLVQKRVEDIQRENQQGIAKMNQAKKQKSLYDADYAIDGFLFDKRK